MSTTPFVRLLGIAAAAVMLIGLSAPVDADPSWNQSPEDAARLEADCVGSTPTVTVERMTFVSGGHTLVACLVFPAASSPDTLVTITHGSGHVVQESWVHHMVRIVDAHGVVAVAMNYRDNYGFPTMWGAQDAITSTTKVLADGRFGDVDHTVLFSVSMGAAIGGTALAESVEGGSPIWQHWVVAEGVSNTYESYLEAAAVGDAIDNDTAKRSAAGMERDAGGTPFEQPDAYRERSPIFRAAEIAETVETAAFVHPVGDGLVGFHQGASMAAAMCANQVHTAFDPIAIGSGAKDDTTLLSHVGLQDINNGTIDVAGHGSESDETHPVMAQAFTRLDQLLSGETYDSGCAQAIAGESISRPGAGPSQPPSTPTPTTTAPALSRTSSGAAAAGTAASVAAPTLAATGGDDQSRWAAGIALVALAALIVRRRVA